MMRLAGQKQTGQWGIVGGGVAGGGRMEREKQQSPAGKVTSLSLMLTALVSFSEKEQKYKR